jgi:hypothetical protein
MHYPPMGTLEPLSRCLLETNLHPQTQDQGIVKTAFGRFDILDVRPEIKPWGHSMAVEGAGRELANLPLHGRDLFQDLHQNTSQVASHGRRQRAGLHHPG